MKYLILLGFIVLSACTTDGHIRNDVLGGAIGGGAGAAIGSEIGGRRGAIIGGAVGGATGTAIGSDSEVSQAKNRRWENDEQGRRDNGRHRGHRKHKHDDDDDEEDD